MFTDFDRLMMRRCFNLASRARRSIQSNPPVGCVITHKNSILAEGYHEVFGGPHAEINALNDVNPSDKKNIRDSTLYVSLEPCNHFGKTPPCVDALLENAVPRVIISALDPNPRMRGKSVAKLKAHNVEVQTGLLQEEGRQLIKVFRQNQLYQMPYVVLKFARSADGFMGIDGRQVWLSNELTKLAVHKWRSELDGILVGTNTALIDNPRLTNRLYPGRSPQRIVIDRNGRIPKSHHLLSDAESTWIYTQVKNYDGSDHSKQAIYMDESKMNLETILRDLYTRNINSILVEGGRQLFDSFVKNNLWNEARIIISPEILKNGLKAPVFDGNLQDSYYMGNNNILIINNLELNKF